ncbi:MAG: type IX secretion system protein PorQ, partial [Bacteroidota bacterium]|nr:type IX secretion system protein PorQ [Bacteroidota bacterium]
VKAQVGGRRALEFLNLPGNARTSALGGINVSSFDNDINMFLSNPALLHPSTHKHISLSHYLFLADITLSTLTYGHNFGKAGVFAAGLQYLNYGSFDGYDDTGLEEGEFGASDYAITLSNSRVTGNFIFGGSMKFANSNIAFYNASALLFDIGGIFRHPERDITLGMAIKNLGFGLSDYAQGSDISLPFDVQMGITFKPQFIPFRFSVTAYNLYPYRVNYQIPGRGGINNEEPGRVDKLMRHITIGTELLLSKNVNIRAGYNHLIKQELKMEEVSGGAGLAFGILIRVKAFEIAYSKAFYHVSGGTDYITVTSNLGAFFKNKNKLNEQNDPGK